MIRREELSGIWRGSIGLAQRRRADEDETEIVPAILCRLLVASYEPPNVADMDRQRVCFQKGDRSSAGLAIAHYRFTLAPKCDCLLSASKSRVRLFPTTAM